MNWRIKELDTRSILSNSDSHSGAKMGREATIFELKKLSFDDVRNAVMKGSIDSTIEFYPEEGKYHYSGHRKCKIRQITGGTCPVCGKPLTAGVMQRVEKLAGRTEEEALKYGVLKRPKFVKLVSLNKIIAESLGVGETSKKIAVIYDKLIETFENELNILMNVSISEISKKSSEKIGEGVGKVRSGDIVIEPGYDGEFGVVKIWGKKSEETLTSGQMSIL
jgi:DNA helicase II / ATP-dependent DNA helicase PcrA